MARASELGIIVDENLRVLDLDPQGSAALAGVQVGDILVDLTLIEVNTTPNLHSDAVIITTPEPTPTVDVVPTSPLPPEAGLDTVENRARPDSDSTDAATNLGVEMNEPVPFTAREEVKSLIGLGGTILLRLDRGGEMVELTFKTTPRAPRPDAPTPTAIMPPQDYF